MDKVAEFKCRYEQWLEMLDLWRNKHNVTRKQAVSILFLDGVGDQEIIAKDLFWKETNEYVIRYLGEKEEERSS
jgi:hypothetical protein